MRSVEAALADPVPSKIATVVRHLRHWWIEPIVDSVDVADCLEALLCGFPDGRGSAAAARG
jgi:hypothetical protein